MTQFRQKTRIYIPSEYINKLVSLTGDKPSWAVEQAVLKIIKQMESANENNKPKR